MFCPKCGTANQDDANFCYKCGTSFAGKVPEQTRYEICQIEGAQITKGFGEIFGRTFRFWAEAVGPKGKYVVAQYEWRDGAYHSPYGPDGQCQQCLRAHSEFIRQLTKDGWEPSEERGEIWYQMRFRRKAVVATEEASFDVILLSAGNRKIDVIKVIRELTNFGLGEAKNLSQSTGAIVLRNVPRSIAESAKEKLESVGATVQLK
jgi:hypothetical protein